MSRKAVPPARRTIVAVRRRYVLKVRLSDDELAELDAVVKIRGGTRAGVARSALVAHVRELEPLQTALAALASDTDWRAFAARVDDPLDWHPLDDD